MTYVHAIGRRHRRRTTASHRLLAVGVALAAAALACGPIAYMVWPKPVPVAPDAPALPITIGKATFNVPPAAIRVPLQRRPGSQARIDLMFLWPSLAPPDPQARPTPADIPTLTDRIFLSIVISDATMPPTERLDAIYPRYLDDAPGKDLDGLTVQRFRAGTPYQGEDLIHDPAAPARFLVRCTQAAGPAPGTCLHERRLPGGADVTVRFARDWLSDWRAVAEGIDALMKSLRPNGG